MNISNQKNLKNLWWLRNIAIIGQASTVLFVTHVMGIELHTFPLWLIISALVLVNIFTLWRVKSAKQIPEYEFFLQLLTDITALFGLLYFTGGATNPFASLFILQVIIAAITLKSTYSWIAAGITIAFYTALMFWSVEVPSFAHHNMEGGEMFNLHIEGMWLSFVILAVIVSWFIVRMNATIRRQNALLADAEKMAAIGTLAASAAHELGTPLTTLSVLSEDMGERMPLFKEQLARCKQIIYRITETAGIGRAQGGAPISLDSFLLAIAERWKADRTETKLLTEIQTGNAPRIIGEYALEQAIRNLLDNAADASPENISMNASWTREEITIRINDNGEGLHPQIIDSIGEAGVTTKQNGLGLGVFLARNVVARLEGKFELQQQNSGGVSASIKLPMRRLGV